MSYPRIDYDEILKYTQRNKSHKNINFTVTLRSKQLRNNNYINNLKRWQKQFSGYNRISRYNVNRAKQFTEIAHGKSLERITNYKRFSLAGIHSLVYINIYNVKEKDSKTTSSHRKTFLSR